MNEMKQLRKDARLGFSFTLSAGTTHYIFGDTIDELIDGLALLKNDKALNIFSQQFETMLSDEQRKRFDALVLQTEDINAISEYTDRIKTLSNIDEFEAFLSSSIEYPYVILRFSKKFRGANFEKMQNAIIQSQNAPAMLQFSEIEGTNLHLLKQAIFQTNQVWPIADFCISHQEVDGLIEKSDIQYVQDLAIAQSDLSTIFHIAKMLKGVDTEKLQTFIIQSKDSYYINRFAEYVKKADIAKLQAAIIESKDAYEMYRFARDVKGADIKTLKKAAIRRNRSLRKQFNDLLKSSH